LGLLLGVRVGVEVLLVVRAQWAHGVGQLVRATGCWAVHLELPDPAEGWRLLGTLVVLLGRAATIIIIRAGLHINRPEHHLPVIGPASSHLPV